MQFYQDSDAFYAVMHKIFDLLNSDPKAIADFHGRKMVVRIHCTSPDAELVLDGRSNPIKVSFGPLASKADLALDLPADLLHGILMGTEGLKAAFMSGRVKVTGNVFRALQLADLFRQIERLYPQVLQESGYAV